MNKNQALNTIYKKNFNRRLNRLKDEKQINYKGVSYKLKDQNVKLAIEYLKEKEEYSQNVNGYGEVAQRRYYHTLDKEITYIQNVLVWFNKWNLIELCEDNIREIYEQIQRGELKSISGNKLSDNTQKDYYSKVLKNGFFAYFNKDSLAQKVIKRKFIEHEEVRFFEFETFKKLVNSMRYKDHELLLWLLFDTGIEINALLRIKKNDFTEKLNANNEKSYIIHVREEIGKKNRSKRDLFIYHNETNELLSKILPTLKDNDNVFNFKWRNAYRIINDNSKLQNLKLKTHDEYIIPKDFRSSCATYFLLIGWSTDEIKARLGHKPSSRVIDRYASYLGLNQKNLQKKKEELDIKNYKEKMDKLTEENRLYAERYSKVLEDLNFIKKFIAENPDIKNKIDAKV